MENNSKILIGLCAFAIYVIWTSTNSAINFFLTSILASLSSALFIYPIIRYLYGGIDEDTLFSSIGFGILFLFLYVIFSNLTTRDMIKVFIEKTIIITLVVSVVNKIVSETKR